MIRIFTFGLMLLCFFTVKAQQLTKLWETEASMDKPESAVYDSSRQVIYVSNINGEYCTKDGNGFIAKVGLDGTIQQLEWITGLDSPQGLALVGDKLYIADVDQVVVADVKNGAVVCRYKAEGAIFLNDVTAEKNGDVYVSDCKTNRVYQLKNNKLEVWHDDPELKGPNGLLCQRKDIVLLNMSRNQIFLIDKRTKSMTEFCSGIENLDGVTKDGSDGYFVSGAWQGEIFHINSKGEKKLLLDLGPEKVITADITYIPEKQILVIPTLKKTVLAYRWK